MTNQQGAPEALRLADAAAPQPSPTPQADSQPVREGEWIDDAGRIKWLLWRVQDLEAKLAARAPAGLAQAETNEVMKLIAACRDAFPIPTSPAGDPLDTRWIAAMCDPSEVPGYLREIAARHAQAAPSVLEDAARLDFLIEQLAYVVSDPDACPGYWLHFIHKETGKCWVQCDEHPTPRAAIDAARKQGASHD